MAERVWHLEHLPHKVYSQICKFNNPVFFTKYLHFNILYLLFPRVAANLKEQEIFLNKFSRAVRLNLLNVRFFIFSWSLVFVAEQEGRSNTRWTFLCFSAFYLMYAKLEENHGLARHAMAIYERSTKAVLPEEQFEVSTLESSVVTYLLFCISFFFKFLQHDRTKIQYFYSTFCLTYTDTRGVKIPWMLEK